MHLHHQMVQTALPFIGFPVISKTIIELGVVPNPDKPERIATKALRHKEELYIILTSCLGGENILLDKSSANMLRF